MFDTTTDRYSTTDKMDTFGIEYNLPIEVNYPRILGLCEYMVDSDNNIDKIYYFGGVDVNTNNVNSDSSTTYHIPALFYDTVLVYDFNTNSCGKYYYILDNIRAYGNSDQCNNFIYILGGLMVQSSLRIQ